MKVARELLQQGRLVELADLITRSPPAEAAHLQAALHLARGEPGLALESARLSLALQANPSSQNTLAICLLACGESQEAAHNLRQLLEKDPDNADLWFNLARCERGCGAARRALELRPDWLQARLLLVSRLAEQNNFREALALIRQDPTPVDARLWEIRLVLWSGRPRQATSLALGMLEESPQASQLLLEALQAAEEIPQDARVLKTLRDHLDRPGVLSLIPAALRLWPDARDLLLHLLREGHVTDYALECELTKWRRDYRENPRPSPLADALAAHNYTFEFAFLEEWGEVPEPDHPAYPLYRPVDTRCAAIGPLTRQRHLEEPEREREATTTSDDPYARVV